MKSPIAPYPRLKKKSGRMYFAICRRSHMMIVVMMILGIIVVIFSFCSLVNVRQTNNAESKIHKNIYPYFIPMKMLY